MHPISYKGSVFSRNQHTQKNNLFMGKIIFENKPLQSLLTREIRDLFFEFRWVVRHSCFCKAIDDVTAACHRYTNLLVLHKDINGIFLFSAVLVTTSWTCCFFPVFVWFEFQIWNLSPLWDALNWKYCIEIDWDRRKKLVAYSGSFSEFLKNSLRLWLRCTSPKVFPETPNEIYPILWRKSMSWQTLKLPEMRLEFASKYFL